MKKLITILTITCAGAFAFANEPTDAEKQEIRAEALVHRAFAYLNLVNVYGEPYRAATAETDQGIPLLTTPRVDGSLPRASVAEVYRQIIQDLNDALEYLPDLSEYNFYPSKCMVYNRFYRIFFLQQSKYLLLLVRSE